MDMIKLKEIADALSVNPETPNCFLKKRITSYRGTPSKPGNIHLLLFLIKKFIGGDVNMIRSSFVNPCIDFICERALRL